MEKMKMFMRQVMGLSLAAFILYIVSSGLVGM